MNSAGLAAPDANDLSGCSKVPTGVMDRCARRDRSDASDAAKRRSAPRAAADMDGSSRGDFAKSVQRGWTRARVEWRFETRDGMTSIVIEIWITGFGDASRHKDGRARDVPWRDQNISTMGYHYYMTPETAAKGLESLPEAISKKPKQWNINDWPDLTKMEIFKK